MHDLGDLVGRLGERAREIEPSSSPRAANERCDQLSAATRARATAASTSAAEKIGTVPITSPVAGL